jgi:hypothetical protein
LPIPQPLERKGATLPNFVDRISLLEEKERERGRVIEDS